MSSTASPSPQTPSSGSAEDVAGFDPSRGTLIYRRRWPRDPSPCDLVPLWAGEFRDFNDWVSFATQRLTGTGDERVEMPAACIDNIGRRCTIGAHFMRARDEGTFPVRYFWECVRPAAHLQPNGEA